MREKTYPVKETMKNFMKHTLAWRDGKNDNKVENQI